MSYASQLAQEAYEAAIDHDVSAEVSQAMARRAARAYAVRWVVVLPSGFVCGLLTEEDAHSVPAAKAPGAIVREATVRDLEKIEDQEEELDVINGDVY